MMPETILLHTIPGSGTVFVEGLLQTDPETAVLALEGEGAIQVRSVDLLVRLLAEKTIDEATFDLLVSYAASLVWHNAALLDSLRACLRVVEKSLGEPTLDKITRFVSLSPIKRVALLSHIYPAGYAGHYWITDLLNTGYRRKVIVPLRDPAMILTSWIIKSVHSQEITDTMMERVMFGCHYLNNLARHCLPNPWFLPVDLSEPFETRRARIEKIFKECLNVPFGDCTEEYVRVWKPLNTITHAQRFNRTREQREVIEVMYLVRAYIEAGHSPRGHHSLFDSHLDELTRMEGLKALYQMHGYRDLCWF